MPLKISLSLVNPLYLFFTVTLSDSGTKIPHNLAKKNVYQDSKDNIKILYNEAYAKTYNPQMETN